MAKEYYVTCTQIYNGTLTVQAESADEAVAIARERLDEVDWNFGEATADYAEEVETDDYPLEVGDRVRWDDPELPGDDRVWEVYDVYDDFAKISTGEIGKPGYSEAEVPYEELIKLED